MSWFTEIAGRAEDLLNRVDQSAATALQSKSGSYTHERKHSHPEFFSPSPSTPVSLPIVPLKLEKSVLAEHSRIPRNVPSTSKQRLPQNNDEQLLQFLNDSEDLPIPGRKERSTEISPRKPLHETESRPQKPGKRNVKGNSEILVGDDPVSSSVSKTTEGSFEPNESETTFKVKENVHASASDGVSLSKKLSSPSLAKSRTKIEKSEPVKDSQKTEHEMQQSSPSDQVTRQLREREGDLVAALDTKDAQLAILKVRLDEADQELQTSRHIAANLEEENDKLIKELAQSAASQNKTIEILQERVAQAEAELNKAKESLSRHQNEHMQKVAKMEEEHRHLVESYSSLQKKWVESNEKNKELSLQWKQSSSNFEALQEEYADYKQKAQRILQSKEKLILSLKGGSLEAETEKSDSALLIAEMESIRQECELLKEELKRAKELADSYRTEVQDLEKASRSDSAAAREQCRSLREQLEQERAEKEQLQLFSSQLKEELQVSKDELSKCKTSYQSRVQEREIEIEKLRRQLTAKSLSTVSQEELESRLHALTENLIQKQTLVETLSTEKNSLVLQLERLEQQLRDARNYGLHQSAYVGINNNDAERKSKTLHLENPFDSALTRRVKKVYGSIDSLSIRLGVFFRRYPITRVFVIIYMLLLHFWVMLVLLTYEPEVHNSRYEAPSSR